MIYDATVSSSVTVYFDAIRTLYTSIRTTPIYSNAYHQEVESALFIAGVASKGFGQMGKFGDGEEIYAAYYIS